MSCVQAIAPGCVSDGPVRAEIGLCVTRLPLHVQSPYPSQLVDYLGTVFTPEDLHTQIKLDPSKCAPPLPAWCPQHLTGQIEA